MNYEILPPEQGGNIDDLEIEAGATDDGAPEGEVAQSEATAPAEDDGDFEIEIEGEQDDDEPHLVKQLRNELRERDRKLAEIQKAQAPKVELGPKPTLEDPDIDYDTDKFEQAMEAWYERKRQVETQEAEAERQREQANQEFQKATTQYRAAAAQKGIRDIDAAEQAVAAALSPQHVGAIVQYSKSPELIIAALHRHPSILNKVAAANGDPMRQFRMIWELESKVKPTMKRNPPPAGESRNTIVSGSTAASSSPDKEEQRLYEEAQRTGDLTKWRQYRKARAA